MLDSDMSKIHAVEQHEDRAFVADDWVEIHFDPPHNHRGKYASSPTARTKADANEGPRASSTMAGPPTGIAPPKCSRTAGPSR